MTSPTPPKPAYLPLTEGHMYESELILLDNFSASLSRDLGLLLEIGTYKGLSASALAKHGPLFCVDTFLGEMTLETGRTEVEGDTLPRFLSNMEKVGLRHQVIPLRGKSDDVLPLLEHTRFRLVFIDGSHHYPQCYRDLLWAWNHLSPGGMLVADDMWTNGVSQAITELGISRGVKGWTNTGKLGYVTKFAGGP